jgi:L-aspartate oxidase
LFDVTTNPREATGDGIAMALRSGVLVADLEFVQFHPTALHHPAMPRPLVSEALRGHGAVLRSSSGERFVEELAPRDVVSRAIARELSESGQESVWLDCTGLEDFARRFPTIHRSLAEVGLDPARDWLPVAPAAHHMSGGVLTDLDGASALPGLWAAGETACTGVHGANRLASNSLLEGMVFGARVVRAITEGAGDDPERARTGALAPDATIPLRPLSACVCASVAAPAPASGGSSQSVGSEPSGSGGGVEARRVALQHTLRAHAGVIRDAASLKSAAVDLDELSEELPGSREPSAAYAELVNLLTVGRGLVEGATAREESRGAHTRADFPEQSPDLRVRLVHGVDAGGSG